MRLLIILPKASFWISILMIFILTSCQKEIQYKPVENIYVEVLSFKEENRKYHDITPNHLVIIPDNPDFVYWDKSTWTGNMRQYVIIDIYYDVEFSIRSSGSGIAYDTEIDFDCMTSGGQDIATVYIGDISNRRDQTMHTTIMFSDIELYSIRNAQAFWYDEP